MISFCFRILTNRGERTGSENTYRSIQHILASLTTDIQLDIRSITTTNIRLRHEERTADLPIQQRCQVLGLLLLVAIFGQHLHIPRIRSRVVGRLRGQLALAQILGHQAVLQVREARTLRVVVLGQEHVPQA